MKNLFKTSISSTNKFLYLLSGAPEQRDQPQGAERAEVVDPAAVTREGMRGVNAQINHIGTLSTEAGEIIGEGLPQLIQGGINSPADAARIGAATGEAREAIVRQMEAGQDGAPEGQDFSPEAYAEVMSWFDEVDTQMAAAQVELTALADANPDNEDLARLLGAFNGMVADVAELREAATEDLSVLEQRALEGGITGPIGERLAQVAQGEVGAADSDAEGNAKYTPGGVDQPWCADFVNYCLEEAGGKGTGSSMAKSFTAESGNGHVAVVADDAGNTIGGNEGNAVSDNGHVDTFEKVISAEDVTAGNFEATKSVDQAQAGDIAVKSRDAGPSASAADQSVT
jgi:hypothetical protein